MTLEEIETRFKNLTKLQLDLTVFPLPKDTPSQVQTVKELSRHFSAVGTPLWLVDEVLMSREDLKPAESILDLCAGYGQFTLRYLRRQANQDPIFELEKVLSTCFFSELQLSYCHRLLRIFGKEINLFIGDSNYLPLLPSQAKGLWIYIERAGTWENISSFSQALFNQREDQFIESVVEIQQQLPVSLRSHREMKKFDLVLSNPPYNRGRDLRLLKSLLGKNDEESISKEFLVIHPSTWLLDLKNFRKRTDSIYNYLRLRLNGKIKSLTFFNGNRIFGIGLFNCCLINHIKLNHQGKSKIDYLGDQFEVDSIFDVTKFGSSWKIVRPFLHSMEEGVSARGSIWDCNLFTQELPEDVFYCQLSSIRGSVDFESNSIMTRHDFYTFLQQDSNKNKGIRNTNIVKVGTKTPTFGFDKESERDNFIAYLKTDFARFCLALYKTGGNMGNGELSLLPIIDFKQPYSTNELYDMFDVPIVLRKYIPKFLSGSTLHP